MTPPHTRFLLDDAAPQWAAASRSPPATRESRGSVIGRSLDGRRWSRLRLIVETIALYLASATVVLYAPARSVGPERWLAVVFPILVLVLHRAGRSPGNRLDGSLIDATAKVLATVSLAAMTTITFDSLLGGADPISLAIRLWLAAALYLGVARVALLAIRKRAQRTGAFCTPTLIIGAGLVGEHLARRLNDEPLLGLHPVGFLDADPLPQPEGLTSDVPILGGPDDLASAIEQTGARHVVLAFSTEPDYVLVETVRQCEKLGVEVSLVPRLYELINERASLDHVGGLPMLSLHPIDPRGWQFAIKHMLDRSVAMLALIMLAPVLGAIALAVRSSSTGGVLFRQRRVGRDGHEFDVLKFRTMRTATLQDDGWELSADGLAPGGVEGEDRRTRIGRVLRDLSLDELPQLINVLHGDMSLVGPRPERPQYVTRFTHDVSHYNDRLRVKSGITGWAQVRGLRGQTSIVDRVEWDNYYIQNWTLRLDLRILALTFGEVLRRRKL